jgi:ArsR family transcriptional regulator, arsenate/arsenite/antimonite-responsive transcriptional repressor
MRKPLDAMAALFQALGDPTRLRILGLLVTGEVCVCHIHESLRIPQPRASRHLAYLRRTGLVDTRREGLWVYYRISASGDPVHGTIKQAVTHALGGIETVRRDTGRLQKKTGSCLPVPSQVCPAAVVDRLPRRRRGLPSSDYSERSKIHPTAAPAATSQVGLIE